MTLKKQKRTYLVYLLKTTIVKNYYLLNYIKFYFLKSNTISNKQKGLVNLLMYKNNLKKKLNICLLTGRKKSNIKKVGLSRQTLNKMLILANLDNFYLSQ